MTMLTPFYLERLEDVSGVSGTGIVAEGVIFDDGQAVLHWLNRGSISIYQSIEVLRQIHGHDGKTLAVVGSKLCTLNKGC